VPGKDHVVVRFLLHDDAGSLITVPAAAFVVGVPAWYAINLTVTMVAFLVWRARRVTRAQRRGNLGECVRPADRRRI
jgi:hypothetical protein